MALLLLKPAIVVKYKSRAASLNVPWLYILAHISQHQVQIEALKGWPSVMAR